MMRESAPQAIDQLKHSQKISYGVGDFGFNLYWATTNLFLLFYYTDVVGLSASTAGLIFMLALIWDGITDPIMGSIADRTRSRWGSYRPYLLLGALPLAASLILLFYRPDLTAGYLVVYTTVVHLLFRTTYTVLSIPYGALSARMTRNSKERNGLAAARMVFATLGALFVSFATLRLAHWWGGDDLVKGFFIVGVVYACISLPVFLFVFLTSSERYSGENLTAPDRPDWRAVLGTLQRNRAFIIVIGAVTLGVASSVLSGKTIVYYFKYNLDAEAEIGTALTISAGVTALFVPVWAAIARRTSKRQTWMIGLAISMTASLALYFNPVETPGVVIAILFVAAAGAAAGSLCFWSSLPDTIEYGEWLSRVRTESLVYGLAQMVIKMAFGVAAGVLGFLLGGIGYVPNVDQSAATLLGLKSIMTLIPAGLSFCGLVLVYFYPIDHILHQRLVRAIEWRAKRTNEAV